MEEEYGKGMEREGKVDCYFEVSAVTGYNVDVMFRTAAEMLFENLCSTQQNRLPSILLHRQVKRKKNNDCC